ncbi:flowering time control protein FCA [Dioscorea cayenensis subsp. rotundata]|uniref:Flowering time control protein FCA n=1 Tax=Dioscorea cayennensis subsp. rotundata TaxID=55577 RepID=A0AB40BWW8_DIOCR|nr:flowering time control protein FCA [Dioscorea cayenensis subsp. rotundata]
MDRHRSDRGGDRGGGDGGGRHSRMPSRWSSAESPTSQQNRYPGHSRGGGAFSGGGEGFSGGAMRHHPYRHPDEYPSPGGGPGIRGGHAGGFRGPTPPFGQKRSGDYQEGGNFAKLFIGSVPRTATEQEIRPLFEEHGEVIEVALIKDKRTGQQQGCCFIKYASSEEADRAIRALHNQYTLPGGSGPIQVRYADGERERLGAVEHKLFVGSLNKQATEKEIEEIFAPYGRVEDVYIMRDELKQSRGCGFVKFSGREMAIAAMSALNGTYVMRGCDQPLIVRFADPKKPRAGESRGGPAFGGPGFGPRSQAPPAVRPGPNFGEPVGGRMPPNAWQPMGPQSMGAPSQVNMDGFGNNKSGKGGIPMPSAGPDSSSGHSGPTNGSLSGVAGKPPPSQNDFNLPVGQNQPAGQQLSPAQKSFISPQHLPPSLQPLHNQQNMVSQSQGQVLQVPPQQLGQIPIPHSGGLPSSQGLPSQNLIGISGQPPVSHPPLQQNASATPLQPPLSLQQLGVSGAATQPVPAASSMSQLLQQPIQQLPSQISQALLQQQAQALQSSVLSSQQAISQLQQQLHLMQQSSINQQQSSQTGKQQPQWTGVTSATPQSASSSTTSSTAVVIPSAASTTPALPATPVVPLTCNWTEHTSPEGYKYYYNSTTRESKWEKPDELVLFEQQQQQQKLLLLQQQQQKLAVQQLQSPSQTQPHTQIPPNRQVSQVQQVAPQMQLNQPPQMQLLQPQLAYQASGVASQPNIQELNYAQLQTSTSVIDPGRVQQGLQAAQEWMWKNKPSGS